MPEMTKRWQEDATTLCCFRPLPKSRPRPSTRGSCRTERARQTLFPGGRADRHGRRYDALRKRYGDIEQRFPDLRTPESLTLKVGVRRPGISPRFGTRCRCFRSTTPFPRRRDAFVDRVRRFLKLGADEPLAFTAEPKIDGLSMSLRYEGGS